MYSTWTSQEATCCAKNPGTHAICSTAPEPWWFHGQPNVNVDIFYKMHAWYK
jgi:hypothetical protein